MANPADYADRLRETLLALAIVPIAGLDAATYWLRESLDRTSRFGADVIATTALGRFTRPQEADTQSGTDPVADVLAQDLLDAARTYVRSMVRLPADSGVYFTGELERRLNALLARIQPEADKDLEGFADAELARQLQELDRLFVVVRAEARRSTSAKSAGADLVRKLDDLRKQVRAARPDLSSRPAAPLSLDTPADGPGGVFGVERARTRARTRVLQALREAERLVPDAKDAIETVATLIQQGLASKPEVAPPKSGPGPAYPPQEGGG